MRFLCFFVLSIFAVFKSFAENIVRDGEPASIHCSFAQQLPQSDLDWAPTPWDSNSIYPVLACIKLEGNINTCKHSAFSSVRVLFHPHWLAKTFRVLSNFDLKDIHVSKKTHCHLFHASEFANLLKDHSVTDCEYMIRASLFAIPEGETTPTFQLTGRALVYHISQPTPDIDATPSDDRTVHAVICSFPNCVVIADGLYSATRTEFFTIREGETPLHEERGGPVTKGMFSVTSFECEPGKCPTKFSAFNLAEPATSQ